MKYISTISLCEIYELDATFFMRRKKEEVFKKNEHYIQQGQTIRWNIEKIETWWRGDSMPSIQKESILNKVLI